MYPLVLDSSEVNSILDGSLRELYRVDGSWLRWQIGNEFYVQESFDLEPDIGDGEIAYYRANYPNSGWRDWQLPRYMPERHSRLRLRLLEVRREKIDSVWHHHLTIERLV